MTSLRPAALVSSLGLLLAASGAASFPGRAVAPQSVEAALPSLKLGDAAPALRVGRWLKGAPVKEFAKGQVYVVEFWATWCGPCRASIPEITKLARTYAGKAAFIGVNVWEDGLDGAVDPKKQAATDAKIEAFVKGQGDRMVYSVCQDTRDRHMASAWLKAANIMGIPATLIVDREGRLAWQGHPMELEKALGEILAGTYDLKAATAAAAKATLEQAAADKEGQILEKAWKEAEPGLKAAVEAKDWARVLALSDQAEAAQAGLKGQLRRYRFQALLATDAAKAQAFLEGGIVATSYDSHWFAWKLILEQKGLEKRWYELALRLMDRALPLNPKAAGFIGIYRFQALLRTDPPKALVLFEEEKGRPQTEEEGILNVLAAIAGEADGLDPVWAQRAVPILEKALGEAEGLDHVGSSLALAYFHAGEPRKAVAMQERFLAHGREEGWPEASLKASERYLERFRAAVK